MAPRKTVRDARPRLFVLLHGTRATLNNQPSADTELPVAASNAANRVLVDLSEFDEFRWGITVTVGGATGADVRPQFSPDESTWTNLDGSNGPEIGINTTGTKNSGWTKLAAGAKRDVTLRLMAKDGDGVADPGIGLAWVEFR